MTVTELLERIQVLTLARMSSGSEKNVQSIKGSLPNQLLKLSFLLRHLLSTCSYEFLILKHYDEESLQEPAELYGSAYKKKKESRSMTAELW